MLDQLDRKRSPPADDRGGAPTFCPVPTDSPPAWHAGHPPSSTHVDDARAALADGTHTHIVGALPFDLRTTRRADRTHTVPPASLIAGNRPRPRCPASRSPAPSRNPSEHAPPDRRGDHACCPTRTPTSPRSSWPAPCTFARATRSIPLDLLARLVAADRNSNGMLADLSPAGPAYRGHHLIGSSPEVLVRKTGSTVDLPPPGRIRSTPARRCGRRARTVRCWSNRPRISMNTPSWSTRSPRPWARCAAGSTCPSAPTLTQTPGSVASGHPHRGDRPRATRPPHSIWPSHLHPTPPSAAPRPADSRASTSSSTRATAVSMPVPSAGATAPGTVSGWSAFAVPNCPATDRTLRASAGGGIVAGSDPELELAETTAKLRTVLSALGVDAGTSDHRI